RDRCPQSTLALHLLPAEVLERLHHAATVDRGARRGAVLELQAESVLVEKLVEELAAQRADGEELVARRGVLQENRRQRLRRRAGDDAGAFGRIVLAVLRAAVDHRGEAVRRAFFAAIADEADVARRVGQAVGADRRVRHDRAPRADAAVPFIVLLIRGL